MKHLRELHRVAALLAWLARIRTLAKLAIDNTHVGVVNVPIDVVVGKVPVQALTRVVGQTAKRHNVVPSKKFSAFLKRQTLPVMDLLRDVLTCKH